jgi:NAD(P)-dependent dehydrogenase (short-subunit alcohol dehydrogenase family)
MKAALNKTIETFGRLDAAFNNAGVEQSPTPTADFAVLPEKFLLMPHRTVGVPLATD